MSARLHLALVTLGALLLSSCATVPRPEALNSADSVAKSQPLAAAAELAPQAFARAEQLRIQATEAYEAEQLSRSEALALHAIAAYQRAAVQARLVAAKERRVRAEQELEAENETLRELGAQQSTLDAQVTALELKLKVIRDTEPPQPVLPDSPKREAARRTAARSIVSGARLLCVAAELVEPGRKQSAQLAKALDALEAQLDKAPSPTPIDEAMRLRASCLKELTLARRPRHRQSPAEDKADVFLTEVGKALPGSSPYRDDRGVVIAETGLFDGSSLTSAGAARVAQLAQIAKANPELPLMVVVHSTRATDKFGAARQQALESTLKNHGLTKSPVHFVGARLPLSVQPVKGSKLKDDRVEFVFVAR